MVLHCDSPASCYIWKQNPVAVGQFDREGDKNKLHPLFPIQTEMSPKEWGKGTYLQGRKVLTRSKTHCLFSIKWCHDWLHNVCTWLQMGFWNIPPLGPAAFVNVRLEEKSKFKMKEMLILSLKEHTRSWEEQIREPEAKQFEVPSVLGGLCCCGECFPSKPD